MIMFMPSMFSLMWNWREQTFWEIRLMELLRYGNISQAETQRIQSRQKQTQ